MIKNKSKVFLFILLIMCVTFILFVSADNGETCSPMFLEETKCQSNAVMKEFQKINCEVTWAFYMPCPDGCVDGHCINSVQNVIIQTEKNNSSGLDYSLSNPFMNFDYNWITEGTFEKRVRTKGDSLTSFIFTLRQPLLIAIPLKNGCYNVYTYHGDLAHAQGPHYIEIEGKVINKYGYNEKGKYIDFETIACVEDNFLNIILGSSTAYLEQNFTFREDGGFGHSMLNAIAIGIESSNPKMYYINLGGGNNNDNNKTTFLLNGLIGDVEDDPTSIETKQPPTIKKEEVNTISTSNKSNSTLSSNKKAVDNKINTISSEKSDPKPSVLEKIIENETQQQTKEEDTISFGFLKFLFWVLIIFIIYWIYTRKKKKNLFIFKNSVRELSKDFENIKKEKDELLKEQENALSELERSKISKEEKLKKQTEILNYFRDKETGLNKAIDHIEKETINKNDIYSKKLEEKIKLEREIALLNEQNIELNKEKIKKEIVTEEKKREVNRIKKSYRNKVNEAKEKYSGEELKIELSGLNEDYEESKEVINNTIEKSLNRIKETDDEIVKVKEDKQEIIKNEKTIDELVLNEREKLVGSKPIIQKKSAKSYEEFIKKFKEKAKDCESWPEYVEVYVLIFGRDKGNIKDLVSYIVNETGVSNEEFVKDKINKLYDEAVKKISMNLVNDLKEIDSMSGDEFEEYLETLFEKLEYKVSKTKRSRDGGVDLILKRNDEITLIQAKRYQLSATVGVSAVRDVNSKKEKYKASHLVVLTTAMKFSVDARQEAKELGIQLWGRNKLKELLKKAKQND
jgi:restriction system protein